MRTIEIDESSKLEQPGDTIIAFSNDSQRTLKITAKVRDVCMQTLAGARFSKTIRIFVAGISLLVSDHLKRHQIERIIIDDEYPKHGPIIKRLLLQLIWKHVDPMYPSSWIEVRRIGEKRPADYIAGQTRKGLRKADKIVKADEILRLWVPRWKSKKKRK